MTLGILGVMLACIDSGVSCADNFGAATAVGLAELKASVRLGWAERPLS